MLMKLPAQDTAILDQRRPPAAAQKTVEATYTRPYQAHASIGPSCAVAQFENGAMTVWSHTQGVYPDRQAIAEMLRMPIEQVRCIHMEGSGCYGHNGADDAAADAALIARALPGRPVRVQWMREQEHGWEPYGPAMVSKVSAAVDAERPDRRLGLRRLEQHPFHAARRRRRADCSAIPVAAVCADPSPSQFPSREGGGDRNAIPLYKLPSARVMHHFLPAMPIRVSALRSLGAYMNVFSIESFMDELAQASGADPVEFRLEASR